MHKIVEVEIKGKKRALIFNNYARVEIARVLNMDPLHILDSIEELSNRNYLLLLKTLVYAGHCGDCYRRQDTTDLTREDIGEWIGDAHDDILFEVYRAFLDAEGFNLPKDDKKKVTKATKKPQKRGPKS